MCKAILEGLRNCLDHKGRRRQGINATLPLGALEEEVLWDQCTALSAALHERGLGDIVDATTGQILRGELVRQARAVEMDYFSARNVYEKRPRAEAIKRTGKPPITVKWVDVNKGDGQTPQLLEPPGRARDQEEVGR